MVATDARGNDMADARGPSTTAAEAQKSVNLRSAPTRMGISKLRYSFSRDLGKALRLQHLHYHDKYLKGDVCPHYIST